MRDEGLPAYLWFSLAAAWLLMIPDLLGAAVIWFGTALAEETLTQMDWVLLVIVLAAGVLLTAATASVWRVDRAVGGRAPERRSALLAGVSIALALTMFVVFWIPVIVNP